VCQTFVWKQSQTIVCICMKTKVLPCGLVIRQFQTKVCYEVPSEKASPAQLQTFVWKIGSDERLSSDFCFMNTSPAMSRVYFDFETEIWPCKTGFWMTEIWLCRQALECQKSDRADRL
jgi:hypothetical protein